MVEAVILVMYMKMYQSGGPFEVRFTSDIACKKAMETIRTKMDQHNSQSGYPISIPLMVCINKFSGEEVK